MQGQGYYQFAGEANLFECDTNPPSASPIESPSASPSASPSVSPSASPSESPSASPSASPSGNPSASPSASPCGSPSAGPSDAPSGSPSESPSGSFYPSSAPSDSPTKSPAPSFIIIATGTTIAVAEETGGTTDCAMNASCNDCLESNNNSCAWVPGIGSSAGEGSDCIESCDMIADVSCYSTQYFDSNLTAADICEIADNNQGDAELCNSQSDCTSCVDSVLSDGKRTCQWFQVEDDGYCGNGCGMLGCGETTCPTSSNNDNDGDGDGDGDSDECETKSSSCRDCLGGGSSCAWIPGLGCIESCDMIADVSCYSSSAYLDSDRTADEICAVAGTDQADASLCGSQVDCMSCVFAVLSDGTSTCQWFLFDGDDAARGGGYCGHECDMLGCGDTTCSVAAGSNGDDSPVVALPSSPPTESEAADLELNSKDGDGTAENGSLIPDESSDAATFVVARNCHGGSIVALVLSFIIIISVGL